MEYAQNELARFDVASAMVSDTLSGSPAVYGLIEDPINGVLYATTTDFFNAGEFHVLNLDGQVISSVPAAVSSGNLALDIRLSTGVEEPQPTRLVAYPNPASDELIVSLAAPAAFSVLDATGRTVIQDSARTSGQHRIEIASLPAGLYTLQVEGAGTLRFTKR